MTNTSGTLVSEPPHRTNPILSAVDAPSSLRHIVLELPNRKVVIEVCTEEAIVDIRHVIAEIYPCCFYTNYNLLYGGHKVPDFEELKTFLDSPSIRATSQPPTLTLQPLPYDERSLRQHLHRFRTLLEDPSVPLLLTEKDPKTQKDTVADRAARIAEPSTPRPKSKGSHKKRHAVKRKAAASKSPEALVSALPFVLNDDFEGDKPFFDAEFPESCFKEAELPDSDAVSRIAQLKPGTQKPACVRYIRSLECNPPPRSGRLKGDLWYLEIGTLEGSALNVVASEHGFILLLTGSPWEPRSTDRSQQRRFWTLHDLLYYASAKYAEQLEKIPIDTLNVDPELPYKLLSPFRPCPSWVKQGESAARVDRDRDSGRMEEALEHALGVDIWEPQREWNEESQLVRELPTAQSPDAYQEASLGPNSPTDTLRDPLTAVNLGRERNLVKILGDTAGVCIKASVNARDGRISPLLSNNEDYQQVAEEEECPDIQIYSWNNLFFLRNWTSSTLDELQYPMPALHSKFNDLLSNTPMEFCSRKGIQADFRAIEVVGSLLHPHGGLPASVPGPKFRLVASAAEPLSPEESREGLPVTPSTACCSLTAPQSAASEQPSDAPTAKLCTLTSFVVDYAGTRFLAQAIMPGLLTATEGSPAAQPLFGASAPTAVYHKTAEIAEALDQQISKSLGLVSHTLRPQPLAATGDQPDEESFVRTTLPLEAKVLKGADGRNYVTDVGRVLPIDLNWFTADEITALETGEAVSAGMAETIKSKACVWVVRPELLGAYLWAREAIVASHAASATGYEEEAASISLRETRARARFEWLRSMGLHTCHELLSHMVFPPQSAGEDPDLWPGLDYLMGGGALQWKSARDRQQGILQLITYKLQSLALPAGAPGSAVVGDDAPAADAAAAQAAMQEQRWSTVFGPGWQVLAALLPDPSETNHRLRSLAHAADPRGKENSLHHYKTLHEQVEDGIARHLLPTAHGNAGQSAASVSSWTSSSGSSPLNAPSVPLDECSVGDAKCPLSSFSFGTDKNTDGVARGATFPAVPSVPQVFNPNLALLDVLQTSSPEERQESLKELQVLAWYLERVAIARLVDHLVANASHICTESGELSRLFHAFGVNMRYLGCILTRVQARTAHAPVQIVEHLEREILCRCINHYFSAIMSRFSIGMLSAVASHLLNLIFAPLGAVIEYPASLLWGESPAPLVNAWLDRSSDTFWERLRARAASYFRCDHLDRNRFLDPERREWRYVVLRSLCRKTGLQLLPEAVTNGLRVSSKQRPDPAVPPSSSRGHEDSSCDSDVPPDEPTGYRPFTEDDVADIVPVLKTDLCSSSVVRDVFLAGFIAHALDLLEVSFECYQNTVQLLHQLNIPLTRECCWAQSGTALVLVMVGDLGGAVLHFRRVILITEQILGPDHPYLIDLYWTLSKLYFALMYTLSNETAVSQQPSSAKATRHSAARVAEPAGVPDTELKLLSLSERALKKAIVLSVVWSGTSYRNTALAQLLVHAAKVLTHRIALATKYQQHSAVTQLLLGHGQEPSKMDVPLKLLSLLGTADRLAAEGEAQIQNSDTFLRAQIEGELASQFCIIGEPRRALAAARRQRNILERILGPAHSDVTMLDGEIMELTKQAVRKAKQDKAAATHLNYLIQQALQQQDTPPS